MPDYRRLYVPGGSYFFTVVTQGRRPLFQGLMAQRLLGHAIRNCQNEWPFEVSAIVLLPDHLHTIWNLPPCDDRYSRRWSRIKRHFTKAWLSVGGREAFVTSDQLRQRRRGVWQPRFWEHTIRDEDDFQAHFDYIHFNPVKHGYARCAKDWPASSFHRWVRAGVYEEGWGCGSHQPFDFTTIEGSIGEP